MDQKYFTNPYNFVPLGEKCDRSPLAENNGESFTGYFTCRMELLTPLFVPNTSNSEALLWKAERSKGLDGNKKEEMGGNNGKQGREASDRKVGYEFCSYDDLSNLEKEQKMSFPPEEPVIPGSEIRGVIRSVYEAAFGGCMSTVLDGTLSSKRKAHKRSRRLPNEKSLETILEKNGVFQPCEDIDSLCSSCKVFGMTAKKAGNRGAVASRVRFTDALLESPLEGNLEANYVGPLVLPASGAPRPETVEFYTLPPYKEGEKACEGEGYWTYNDYYVKENSGRKREKLGESLPKIRGRKFYWHHKNCMQIQKTRGQNAPIGKMQQRIRPIKESGIDKKRIFTFRVYFEKLNKEELDHLRWSIDFCDDSCAHKLGRGKPFGLGSVKIHISEMKRMLMDFNTGLLSLDEYVYKNLGKDIEVKEDPIRTLKLMAKYGEHPDNISYPYVKKNGGKSFEWFKRNRNSMATPYFSKILPKPTEEFEKDPKVSKKLSAKDNL